MIKRGDLNFRVIFILGLVVFSVFYLYPLNKTINLGLDLKGGMSILLRPDLSSVPPDKVDEALQGAVEKIRNRVDTYGVAEVPIQVQGDKSILVQVPGLINREIVEKLKKVGKLEFRIVEEDKSKLEAALKGEVPQEYELKEIDKMPLLVYKEAALTGSALARSDIKYGTYGTPEIRLEFTTEGSKAFAKVTEQNVGKRLAIVLDGKVMSAPVITEPILSGGAQITGRFTFDEAKLLTSVLNSGALPIPLVLEEERSVGPLLGSDSIKGGVNSTLLGAILVVVFMLVYYLLGGVIAVIDLILDVIFILVGLRLFHATLTLPGIAGIVLTLGMAVDGNVLIYERIREELSEGKPLSIAIDNGFSRAKNTIFDSNLTTLIAAVFLLFFGTGPIRGFATTLSLGIVISMFTVIFVSKTIFSFLLNLKLKKFVMFRLFLPANINFVKLINVCIIGSLIIIFAGMFNFYSRRNNIYGVDFKGGQILEYKITPPANIEVVRNTLKNNGFTQLEIQDFKNIAGGIIIKSKDDISARIETALKNNFGTIEELRVTTVGPTIGKILKKKALLAVVFSLIGILIYVTFRFKHFDFAIAAVIALLHDILISLGALSLANYEVSLLTVTAILTLAGYSINDTIVIYDRIREVSNRFPKLSLKEVINQAINSTLSRTILTSFTTILVVAAIYFAGGEVLKGFSFVLIVGIITGTYSSIYIASPLVLLFRRSHLYRK